MNRLAPFAALVLLAIAVALTCCVIPSDIGKLSALEGDIEAYYAANKAQFWHDEMIRGRLILFSTLQNPKDVAKKNAEAILSVLDDPKADFAGLARELSEDPATKAEGGDMGWFTRKGYAREITDAAFSVPPGKHTGIIEYADGFAIVLVEAKQPAGYESLDLARSTIASLLRREKQAPFGVGWPPAGASPPSLQSTTGP